eukprot:GEMP01091663.1.p1 GENE.GEMP01091663.1~~GEMP01091663.1.p1  ORF type:complete len:136 (+),score=9.48 GEMP01091663.1:406-813(+)
MTDTTEQSALQKQPKRKTRRASSVRISNVLEVDDGGLHSMARSSINAIDQGKSAELGLFSDPVVSTSAKSFRYQEFELFHACSQYDVTCLSGLCRNTKTNKFSHHCMEGYFKQNKLVLCQRGVVGRAFCCCNKVG